MTSKYVLEIYRLNVSAGTFTRIDVITTFKNLTFYNKLSGIGGARFELAVQDLKATRENLTRYRNQVVIKRYGQVVWFGPITDWNIEYTDVAGTITVDCNSYLFHLNARYTDKLKNYPAQDISLIADDLINTIQARTNGNLGITLGSTPTSITRDMTYEYKSIADCLIELSDLVGGFDFDFTPIVDSNGLFTGTYFNTYPTKLGSTRRDLPVLTLGQNIKKISLKNAQDIFNSSIAEGSGTGESVPTSQLDYGTSQQTYTRRETILSLKDASLASTVGYYNAAYLNMTSVEQLTLDIDLYQNRGITFTDLNLGDILYITSHIGQPDSLLYFTKYEGRIIEINITVDAQGAETLTPRFNMIF